MVQGVRANLLRNVRSELAETLGILVTYGTATGATGTTLADTDRLAFNAASELIGYWIYIHTGTGIGQERRITASTAAGTVTVPTWTTTPDTTSQYIVTKYFSAHELDRAIDEAISAYASRVSIPWESHYLGVDNIFNDPDNIGQITSAGLIYNWQFDEWDTANNPNDWSVTDANADEENTALAWGSHRRAFKIQNTASATGSATLSVGNYPKWAGKRVRGYAILNTNTASRLFTRVADGVANTDSSNHAGNGLWSRLDTGWKTVSDNPTSLSQSFQISSGAQITAYGLSAYLQSAEHFQEYVLPQAFTVVEAIYFEMTAFNDYGRFTQEPLADNLWEIRESGLTDVRTRQDSGRGQDAILFPRLVLRTDLFSPPSPARIRVVGRGFPNLIAAVATQAGGPGGTTNYENISPVVAPELIRFAAALDLNERLPRNAQIVSSAYLTSRVQSLERTFTVRMPKFGRRVRRW